MSEWREATLADICEDVSYGFTASASDDPELPRFLRITDIVPDAIDWRTVPGCAIAPKDEVKHALRPGDIVVARTGATVGYAKRIRHDVRAVAASYLVRFRPSEAVDAAFVGHVVESAAYKEFVKTNAGGAAQPNANAKVLGSFLLQLPDRPAQQRISAILDALDDLIENNRRRIVVLEEMAQAIYREWFVHFRYPGHEDATFVDSPLGPIPDGWEVGALGQIASVNLGARKPSDDEIIRYLDISSLGDRWLDTPPEIGGESAPGRARRRVKPGDVVWSMVRPNRRAHALLVEPGQDWIASTGLAVLTPRSVASGFLFETVSSPDFSDYLVSQEGGSAYPAVKPKDFETAPLVRPPSDVESAFSAAVEPMHRQAWALRLMCDRLAELRDLLLPKLVTGEIDVSAIDLDALVGTVS